MKNTWVRRRWYDFRMGHSVYLIFLLSFSNFLLIFHRLLIERITFLSDIFSELWIFAVFFIILYIPLSIGIGAWHRKTQIRIETEQTMLNNPFLAYNFRILVDIIDGKLSSEDIEKFRKLMTKIEKRADSNLFD